MKREIHHCSESWEQPLHPRIARQADRQCRDVAVGQERDAAPRPASLEVRDAVVVQGQSPELQLSMSGRVLGSLPPPTLSSGLWNLTAHEHLIAGGRAFEPLI